MERIAILGMGPIGASIGLGLKRAGLEDTEVVGVDGSRDALSRARKLGALDAATGDLKAALKGSQLVVISAPVSEMRSLLEAVGPNLERGCVVSDTGTSKVQVMDWAETYLPRENSFVGGCPVPKQPLTTLEEADAALFDGSYYCVTPAETADAQAVKSVVGMVEALGASPLFIDAHEHDSFAAALVHLPVVLSAALVGSITASESWSEMSRLAGPEFQEATHLAANDPLDSAVASRASAGALVHWIDRLIEELGSYRDQVQQDDERLLEKLVNAWERRARWEAGGGDEEPGLDRPSTGDSLGEAVFGARLVKRYRQIMSAGKRPSWKYPIGS